MGGLQPITMSLIDGTIICHLSGLHRAVRFIRIATAASYQKESLEILITAQTPYASGLKAQ